MRLSLMKMGIDSAIYRMAFLKNPGNKRKTNIKQKTKRMIIKQYIQYLNVHLRNFHPTVVYHVPSQHWSGKFFGLGCFS